MKKLKDRVYWVGATDWKVRYFHGYELSTHRGSTYNSYLTWIRQVILKTSKVLAILLLNKFFKNF